MSVNPPTNGISKATKFLGLIGVMAGALTGFLGAAGYTQAATITGAIAVTATAGAHFT